MTTQHPTFEWSELLLALLLLLVLVISLLAESDGFESTASPASPPANTIPDARSH